MILPFETYLKQGKVNRKTPDPEEAKSLSHRAAERLDYIGTKTLAERTAPFILEDAYEVMRESAQSLMALRGFKPYSHEATISFIKEYYTDVFSESDIRSFDRFRQLRNNSVYRAVQVTLADAKECLELSRIFVEKVAGLIE